MHLFFSQNPLLFHIFPTCVLALALGIMWGSPAAHAMFESENSLNRPHTSQAGPDLAQYKAMFDTRYDVNTTDLTTQQFFRLSSLAQAYENKTKKDLMAQGHAPTDSDIITPALKSAIESLIEFVQEGDDLLQHRIFALIQQHLLRPAHPQTMPTCANVLRKFFLNPHLSDTDKENRLSCLPKINCNPHHLHSKLKHMLYMPPSEFTTTNRRHSTHDDS